MRYLLSILFVLVLTDYSVVTGQQKIERDSHPSKIDSQYYIERATYWYENEHLDSVLYYLENGLQYYKEIAYWENYLLCLNGLVATYDVTGNYAKKFALAKEAPNITPLLSNLESSAYAYMLNNMASIQLDKNEFDKAIELFEEALDIEKKLGKLDTQIPMLRSIGKCHLNKGDYEECLVYYDEALRIQKNELGEYNANLALTYNLLADIYSLQTRHDTAIVLLHKSLDILKSLSQQTDVTNIKQQINAHLQLAKIYVELNEESKFFTHIEKVAFLEATFMDKKSGMPEIIIGNWFMDHMELDEALDSYLEALEIRISNYSPFQYHPKIGEIHKKLGDVYGSMDQVTLSLSHYQKALEHFSFNFQSTDHFQNPDITQLSLDDQVLDILHAKAKVLQAMRSVSPDDSKKYLNHTKQTYKLLIQAVEHLRNDFLSQKAKANLSQQIAGIYADAMLCYYEVYMEEPTEGNKTDIFQLMESNKSSILYESINESLAKKYAEIPDSLKLLENDLRKEISFYERIISERNSVTDSKSLEELQTALFAKRRQYQKLIKTFEVDYPDYYDLKHNDHRVSITDVQNALPNPSTCLIEYYIDRQYIYGLTISKDESRIIRLPVLGEDLTDLIHRIRQLTSKAPNATSAHIEYADFCRIAHRLYLFLIRPLELRDDVERLIIIPDEDVAQLPFEILIQDQVSHNEVDYSSMHLNYLLLKYDVSYNYSAKLHILPSRKSTQTLHGITSFAPDFSSPHDQVSELRDCEGNQLYALKCSIEESMDVSRLLNGKALTKHEATKEAFLEMAPKSSIVHLATHACINETDPMLSKIFFSGDEYITNYELYDLNLNADLVVLSACNTGTGKLIKGEGIMNLNRGFLQAGCPSSLISLWSIDDCSSKEVMTSYYSYLKKGRSKDTAIRQAKIDFLQQADRLHAHPFYWSPFIQYGDIDQIETSSNYKLYYLMALVAILLTVVYIARSRLLR